MMRRQTRNMTASVEAPSKVSSSRPTSQFADKPRQQSNRDSNSPRTSDRQRIRGSGVDKNVHVSQSRPEHSQVVFRDRKSQLSTNHVNSRASRTDERAYHSPARPAVEGERPIEFLPAKPVNRVRRMEVRGQRGSGIHRAEGVFDLSSLHLSVDHRGSVANLLEEFKKQAFILDSHSSASKSKMENNVSSNMAAPASRNAPTSPNVRTSRNTPTSPSVRPSRNAPASPQLRTSPNVPTSQTGPTSQNASASGNILPPRNIPVSCAEKSCATTVPKTVAPANTISASPVEPIRGDKSLPKMDKSTAQELGYLTKNRKCSREITASEEELLTQILLTMSRSSLHKHPVEDESDYANLWESESGSTSTFQTNKDVMGSLMRKKVSHRVYSDDPRRNACISTSQSTEPDCAGFCLDSVSPFDMDKFKSLQEKAENMDLTLTDFFADLKHSSSLLELSSSTIKLSPKDCKYKCHTGCEDLIQNSCPGPEIDRIPEDGDKWTDSKTLQDVDDTDSGYSGSGGSAGFTLTKEEICSKIHAYNKSVGLASGAMTLPAADSDSFQGNIKVCVCITRPINRSLSSRPTSIYEALHREAELSPQASPSNTVLTHEHIPQNAVVSLHTDSCDTAIEVVSILLNKIKITDNPKSFALFEQTIQNEKEVKLRKVGDQERPLLNYLRWITENNESKRFVLKENDSGDIMYEAFSIPELNNFLRVLEHEEAERLTEIQNKYLVRRKQLSDRLREIEQERKRNRSSAKAVR